MAQQDILSRTTEELRARIAELEPLVQEHERLKRALSALEASDAGTQPSGTRASGSRSRRRTTSRRAGRGERRLQLLEVITREPGLRPSDAARRMEVNPSQLHALARRLEEQGALERRDGALYPSATEATAAS